MHYIVYDLEFNQVCPTFPKCPFEIIQIGAIKLDETLQVCESFNRLIKPTLYDQMNPFISKLTSITMEQLMQQSTFIEVYPSFLEFIENEENILCIWGMADVTELFRNILYHQLSTHPIPKHYINLQPYTAQHLNFNTGTLISLRNAIEFLDIPISQPFHDAYNDAFYTSEILKKLSDMNIVPELYNLSGLFKPTKIRPKRKIVDLAGLYQQFEKMYGRILTDEERSIIKTAYFMGKTHQFEK